VAGLLQISGSVDETGGYRRLTHDDLQACRALFQTAVTATARALVKAHPELTNEALAHPWIAQNRDSGPLARLASGPRAIKALSLLLLDSATVRGFQQEGRFGWDDGSAQAAMAVTYAWGKVVGQPRGAVESAAEVHQQAKAVLSFALAEHEETSALQLVATRHATAWRWLQSKEQDAAFATLGRLAKVEDAEATAGIALLASTALVDAGLRLRRRQPIDAGLARVRALVAPEGAEPPRLRVWRGWADTLFGVV